MKNYENQVNRNLQHNRIIYNPNNNFINPYLNTPFQGNQFYQYNRNPYIYYTNNVNQNHTLHYNMNFTPVIFIQQQPFPYGNI